MSKRNKRKNRKRNDRERSNRLLEEKREKLKGIKKPSSMNNWLAPGIMLVAVFAVVAYAISQGGSSTPKQVILPADAPLPGLKTEAPPATEDQPAPAATEAPYVYKPQRVDYSGKSISLSTLKVKDAGEYIELSLEDLLAKKFLRFDYQGPSKKVPMLAYVAPSGRIITAVRVCEPCKNYDRFFIQGNVLVCGKCGTKWTLEDLNGISGGCMAYPPDEIPSVIRGRSVFVKKADMEAWKERVVRR